MEKPDEKGFWVGNKGGCGMKAYIIFCLVLFGLNLIVKIIALAKSEYPRVQENNIGGDVLDIIFFGFLLLIGINLLI